MRAGSDKASFRKYASLLNAAIALTANSVVTARLKMKNRHNRYILTISCYVVVDKVGIQG